MTIRQIVLAMLVVMSIFSVSLVLASQNKRKFYEELNGKYSTIISDLKPLNPIEKQEDSFNEEEFLHNYQNAKVKILSIDGYPKELRYYNKRNLIAIDKFGQGGRVVRRDLLHEGYVRIRLFYDLNKEPIRRRFLDQNENIVIDDIIIPPNFIMIGYS